MDNYLGWCAAGEVPRDIQINLKYKYFWVKILIFNILLFKQYFPNKRFAKSPLFLHGRFF